MKRRPANALAALRQLACLGLPGRTVLPDAVRLLAELVDFEVALAGYVDDDFELSGAWFAGPAPVAALRDYAENFYNRADGEGRGGITTRELIERDLPMVHHTRLTLMRLLRASAFYERFLEPAGIGWACAMGLRVGARPIGQLVMSRPFALPDFDAAEIRRLAQARPWLCHAFARSAAGDDVRGEGGSGGGADGGTVPAISVELAPPGESGTLVVDARGRLLAAGSRALLLLFEAGGGGALGDALARLAPGDGSVLLERLAAAALAAAAGRDGPLPVLAVRNAFGDYVLRAHVLDAFTTDHPAQVSIGIERTTPVTLRLFRAPAFLALTPRERDVCLALLAGRETRAIAASLGIQPSSVIHHTRALYQRLGITRRAELLATLTRPTLPADQVAL